MEKLGKGRCGASFYLWWGWSSFLMLSAAFRGSTKKLYSEDLSGILRLGFQQNSIFQEFVGHLSLCLPTGFNYQES